MDYFSFRITVEVLRREFGNNTEVALENVFGFLLLCEKGSLKASPVLPSQHKCSPRAPGMCRHVPGMSFLDTLHPSPSACPTSPPSPGLWGCTALHWGPAESQKDHYQRARPSSHPGFGGAQLPAAAAAVNSECGWGAPVNSVELSHCAKGSCGPAFQLHHGKFARGKRAEA